MTLTKQNNIGRWVTVLHDNELLVGTVIDLVAGTKTPKRVRIQRGRMQGNVLQPYEYVFKNWLSDEEIDP